MALVLAMVAGFHLATGALMPRMRALGLALHAVGTAALGGGIILAGQIFNLQEHWPGCILLWAVGASLSWWVLRDWLQGSLAALLVPAWIASEWTFSLSPIPPATQAALRRARSFGSSPPFRARAPRDPYRLA